MSYVPSAANLPVLGKLAAAITAATPIETRGQFDPPSFMARVPQEAGNPLLVFDTIPALDPTFWGERDLITLSPDRAHPKWLIGKNVYRHGKLAQGHPDPKMNIIYPRGEGPTVYEPLQGYRIPFVALNPDVQTHGQGIGLNMNGDFAAVVLEGAVAFGVVAQASGQRRIFTSPAGTAPPLSLHRVLERPAADFSVNLMCRLRPGRFRQHVQMREGPPPRALVIVFPGSAHPRATGTSLLSEDELLVEISKTVRLYGQATGVFPNDHDHKSVLLSGARDGWALPAWVPMGPLGSGLSQEFAARGLSK